MKDVFLMTLSIQDSFAGEVFPFAGVEIEEIWSRHTFLNKIEAYQNMQGVSSRVDLSTRMYDPKDLSRQVYHVK
jgi:hypothetical protein